MAFQMPSFPPFDTEGDPNGLSIRWREYLERFQNFLLAMDITDDTRQRAMLLHYGGEGIYRIFKGLSETGEAKDFKLAVDKLNEYFCPKRNIEYERYVFRQAKQLPSETLDAFHTRLHNLSHACEFSDPDSDNKS